MNSRSFPLPRGVTGTERNWFSIHAAEKEPVSNATWSKKRNWNLIHVAETEPAHQVK